MTSQAEQGVRAVAPEEHPDTAVGARDDPPDGAGRAPFTVRERVRWSDVDAAGIVCFGMYLRFFELAESELFGAVGLPTSALLDDHGLWLVRRRIGCDFLRPLSLDQELEISVAVGAMGRSSLELIFSVAAAGEGSRAAEARYLLVAVDRDSLRPVPLPDLLRSALRPYRLPADPRDRRSARGEIVLSPTRLS